MLLTALRIPRGVIPAGVILHRSFCATAFANILVEKRASGIAIVTLNRPKQLNALSDSLMRDVNRALLEFRENDDVRAVVLTGNGKAFAAGADIKEMADCDIAQVRKGNMLATWQNVKLFQKPIIAAVNGYALGGGCELAMMCDIVLASDRAKFGQPEVLIGTIPGAGGSQRLTRAVGKSKAMEWILTGVSFSAQEAEKRGLISRVVEHDQLLPEAIKLAEQIAGLSSPVIQAAKECVNRSYETPLSEGLLYELRQFHSTWGIADRHEGMQAFIAKRAPKWSHK